MGAVAHGLWIFVSIAGCPARPVLPKPLVFWQCISTKWKPALDTLEPFVGGTFPALQFNPSQKPFVVFGIVSKAGAHTCVKRAFENKKLPLES